MEIWKRTLSVTLALSLLLFAIGIVPITAHADSEPVTYTKYSWDDTTNTLSQTTETAAPPET